MSNLDSPDNLSPAFDIPAWVDAVYNGHHPEKAPLYTSAAVCHLLDALPRYIEHFRNLYPEENRTNEVIGVFVLARAVEYWSQKYDPQPNDWYNFRQNIGLLQQQYGQQLKKWFPDEKRPSFAEWLDKISNIASGLTHDQLLHRTIKSGLRDADKVGEPLFWKGVTAGLFQNPHYKEGISVTERMELILNTIDRMREGHRSIKQFEREAGVGAYIDYFYDLPIHKVAPPITDYSKSWELAYLSYIAAFVKKELAPKVDDLVNVAKADVFYFKQQIAQEQTARTEWLAKTYQPWAWSELKEATLDEKASVWAWMTSWAPEYQWDPFLKTVGIYPPVEAVTREEYTGKSTAWWLSASFEDKKAAALEWMTLSHGVSTEQTGVKYLNDFYSQV